MLIWHAFTQGIKDGENSSKNETANIIIFKFANCSAARKVRTFKRLGRDEERLQAQVEGSRRWRRLQDHALHRWTPGDRKTLLDNCRLFQQGKKHTINFNDNLNSFLISKIF